MSTLVEAVKPPGPLAKTLVRMESLSLSTQDSEWIETGPDWIPDVPPLKYAGAVIRWSATHFDSVVIPLIVTTKHVFWDIRVSAFEVTDHTLEIVVDLPSIHGPEQSMVSFNETDMPPAGVAKEMADVLDTVGGQVLSETWQYRIVFRQGDRSETFEGQLAGDE